MRNHYKEMIISAVNTCDEVELLDLVYKLLSTTKKENSGTIKWAPVTGHEDSYEVSTMGECAT